MKIVNRDQFIVNILGTSGIITTFTPTGATYAFQWLDPSEWNARYLSDSMVSQGDTGDYNSLEVLEIAKQLACLEAEKYGKQNRNLFD